jgi:serine-type D-Ala-D-Ala carboxypeptidase (penicillin-binding protein 5/6)
MHRFLVSLFSLVLISSVGAADGPSIRAPRYIMVDATTGVPMIERGADLSCAVASTQKILTAMVVLDQGNLDKKVTIARTDTQVEPTALGIRAGEVYTRRHLLYVVLIKSANDVAKALARDVAGSQENFAAMMNAKARAYGMSKSHFVNAHGLPAKGQYSTARDMARAALMAYRYPLLRDATRRSYYTITSQAGRTLTVKSTNELLGRMDACDGMKTGYTNAAGRCLISSASTGGRSVILIQLGTKTKYIWDDAQVMMNWGLRRARG